MSVKRQFKNLINSAVRPYGYELCPKRSETPPTHEFWPWLRRTQHIKSLVDIGANTGDFGAFLSQVFQPEVTCAFEPLPVCLPALRAKSQVIRNLRVFDVALSDADGEAQFFQNSYPPSSSLLRVSEYKKQQFPQTAGEAPIRVSVRRLDDLLTPEELPRNILIKLDVQGLEDRVIRGGRRLFQAAQCVLVEMSFVPLYSGQPLFEEVHALLADFGYRFAGMRNQIDARDDGRPLFAHCLYLRAGRTNG